MIMLIINYHPPPATACNPPPSPKGVATYNHTGPTLWGITIEYYCSFGFYFHPNFGDKNLTSTCDEGSWTRATIPPCFGECLAVSGVDR